MNLSKRAIVGAAVVALLASTARAQETHFAGNTVGCFYYTATVCTPSSSMTLGGLTYTSLDPADGFQFNDFSDEDGYLPVGGPVQNFGMFTLRADNNFDYTDWNFMLKVMFSAPPGVSTVNYATLQGKVVRNGNGLSVNFDTAPVQLTATDGTVFDVTINQTSLTRRDGTESVDAFVNGNLQVTATPEPATIGLMAFGLVGLVPVVRHRRRQMRAES